MEHHGKYGITKRSRMLSKHSYTGPTWEYLGITNPQDSFETKAEAQKYADLLGEYNKVGFVVFEFSDERDTLLAHIDQLNNTIHKLQNALTAERKHNFSEFVRLNLIQGVSKEGSLLMYGSDIPSNWEFRFSRNAAWLNVAKTKPDNDTIFECRPHLERRV